jgi:hypothetical protein
VNIHPGAKWHLKSLSHWWCSSESWHHIEAQVYTSVSEKHTASWRWKQYVFLVCWYLPMSLYSVATQKNAIFIAVWTSDITGILVVPAFQESTHLILCGFDCHHAYFYSRKFSENFHFIFCSKMYNLAHTVELQTGRN